MQSDFEALRKSQLKAAVIEILRRKSQQHLKVTGADLDTLGSYLECYQFFENFKRENGERAYAFLINALQYETFEENHTIITYGILCFYDLLRRHGRQVLHSIRGRGSRTRTASSNSKLHTRGADRIHQQKRGLYSKGRCLLPPCCTHEAIL